MISILCSDVPCSVTRTNDKPKSKMISETELALMVELRGAKNRALDCWERHLPSLVDVTFANVNDPELRNAFRDYVIKGKCAPQYGDALFDHVYFVLGHYAAMNDIFYYNDKYSEGGDIIYSGCRLRRRIGPLAPMSCFNRIVFCGDSMTFRFDNVHQARISVV
jgi:hypothetical protein